MDKKDQIIKRLNIRLSLENHTYLKKLCADANISITEWLIERIELERELRK